MEERTDAFALSTRLEFFFVFSVLSSLSLFFFLSPRRLTGHVSSDGGCWEVETALRVRAEAKTKRTEKGAERDEPSLSKGRRK